MSLKSAIDCLGGSEAVAGIVGVRANAVWMAVSRGAFPSSWFDLIDGAASAKGLALSRDLFAFRKKEAPNSGAGL